MVTAAYLFRQRAGQNGVEPGGAKRMPPLGDLMVLLGIGQLNPSLGQNPAAGRRRMKASRPALLFMILSFALPRLTQYHI